MAHHLVRLVVAAFSLAALGAAVAQERRLVSIQFSEESKAKGARFDVVYFRTINKAVPSVGPITIPPYKRKNKDPEARKKLRAYVPDTLWDDAFVSAFDEAFAESHYDSWWPKSRAAHKGAKAAIRLEISTEHYGFRIVDPTRWSLAPYVEIDYRVRGTGFTGTKEVFSYDGEKRTSYESWLRESETIRPELDATLKQAARAFVTAILNNAGN